MRWFFNLIFQLAAAAVVIFALTAAWVVFDGLTDVGEKADVGVVTGHSEAVHGATDHLLDRVIELYNDGAFAQVIITANRWAEIDGKGETMAQYLERHGLPAGAIIADNVESSTSDAALRVAEIMKARDYKSVLVVTDYYHVTRMKLALRHDGVGDVQKAHVGKLQKEDALRIAREVVALYAYIGKVYLMPAAEKAKEEAQVGLDKAKVEAEKAKKTVDQKIDSMAK